TAGHSSPRITGPRGGQEKALENAADHRPAVRHPAGPHRLRPAWFAVFRRAGGAGRYGPCHLPGRHRRRFARPLTSGRTTMDPFQYRDGQLCAEELPLNDLAERFGTPLYVYSRAMLE